MRFYGGDDPMAWLTRIPVALVRAHATMMDRLRAEESLRGAAVAAVGAGNRKKFQARQQLARWERDARPPLRREGVAKASPEVLRPMGIGFRTVKANG